MRLWAQTPLPVAAQIWELIFTISGVPEKPVESLGKSCLADDEIHSIASFLSSISFAAH